MNQTKDPGLPTESLPSFDADAEETLPPTPVLDMARGPQGAAEGAAGSPSAGWQPAEGGSRSTPNQDQMVTPLPLGAPPAVKEQAARRERASCLLGFLVGLSLAVGLISLLLTGFLLYSLANVRQATIKGLDVAIDSLENLETNGFQYKYQFNDKLPVSVEIPVQQEMVVPFQGDFPINTTVKVPIQAGVLGTFVLDVPINTSVPVDVEVPVQISQTVAVSTSIPISMTVPIAVTAEDPAIQGFVASLRQWLLDLRESFDVQILAPLLSSR